MVSADIGNHSCCRGFDRQQKGEVVIWAPQVAKPYRKEVGDTVLPTRFGKREVWETGTVVIKTEAVAMSSGNSV